MQGTDEKRLAGGAVATQDCTSISLQVDGCARRREKWASHFRGCKRACIAGLLLVTSCAHGDMCCVPVLMLMLPMPACSCVARLPCRRR